MFKMMCMQQNTCHYGSQVLVTVMHIMSVCCICACFLISLFFSSLFSEDLGYHPNIVFKASSFSHAYEAFCNIKMPPFAK